MRLPRREGWYWHRNLGVVKVSRVGNAWFSTHHDRVGGIPQAAGMVLTSAVWIAFVEPLVPDEGS